MPNTREKLIDAIEKEKPYIPTEDYEVGYNNGLTMAQSIILATDNNVGHKWIPVTERLPEEYETVLTYDGYSVEPSVFYGGNGFYELDKYEAHSLYGVTHWMPLPDPPKGE